MGKLEKMHAMTELTAVAVVRSLSHSSSATPWTAAHQAPLLTGFSRQ